MESEYLIYKIIIEKSADSGWEAYIKSINFYDLNNKPVQYKKFTAMNGGNKPIKGFSNNQEYLYRTVENPGKSKDWLIFEFDKRFKLGSLSFKQYGSSCNYFCDFKLFGSLDGTKWECILSDSNIPILDYKHNFSVIKENESIDMYKDRVVSISDYKKNIGGSEKCMVFLGEDVALVIEDSCIFKFNYGYKPMLTILDYLDKLKNAYSQLTNFTPKPNSFMGKSLRVEVAMLNAGGLASHGVYGIAVGPAFLEETYNMVAKGERVLHQIFYYEMFRNYINPDTFTPAFDYAVKTNKDSWGWVNQGFINIVGCLICKDQLNLDFYYFGNNRDGFRKSVEEFVYKYKELSLSWDDCLGKHHLVPWNSNHSIDNIWSGIISILYDMCGKDLFLQKLLSLLPEYSKKRGGSKYDKSNQVEAMHSFVSAVIKASINAKRETLLSFFKSLNWKIDEKLL